MGTTQKSNLDAPNNNKTVWRLESQINQGYNIGLIVSYYHFTIIYSMFESN